MTAPSVPAPGLSVEETRWMDRALELAERARGRTSPNPLVGAVLVKDGRVIGEGFHTRAGEPHAEAVALAEAGDAARGATLYVTLEPCAHHGRTPPCAGALRDAGVARVVSALEDPDERVRGRGHALLREAGIDVRAGVAPGRAAALNAEYLHRVRTGRAFGVLKAAVTLDGRLGADGGDSRWITGPEARRRAHEFRDRYDAVLIGRGTLDRDDPSLDVRHVAGRDPVAVVLASDGRLEPGRKLWERAASGSQVLVAVADGASTFSDFSGVEQLPVAATPDGRIDLPDLFRCLAGRGLNSVLIEGGERVHTSALASGVVQRAHIFVAPRILGGAAGPRLVGDLGIGRVADGFRLRDPEVERLGPDVLISGDVVRGGE